MSIVYTKYGRIRGVDMGSYTEYRGVPYAQPSIGKLRWRALRQLQYIGPDCRPKMGI